MKLEQKTITTIHADEGKLLVRKSDGHIAGESVTLGYNYYEAGVALSNPRLEIPEDYEEIDIPEDYEQTPIINHVRRLKRAQELIKQNTAEINSLNLSPKDSLEVVDWFPEWGVADMPVVELPQKGSRTISPSLVDDSIILSKRYKGF